MIAIASVIQCRTEQRPQRLARALEHSEEIIMFVQGESFDCRVERVAVILVPTIILDNDYVAILSCK